MLQPISRTVFRSASILRAPISRPYPTVGRRLASTAPADQPRSWRSSATRWGVVIAGLYYYNTSKIFAEEPASAVQPPKTYVESETMPTVDELSAQRRQQVLARQSTSTSIATSNQAAAAMPTSDVGLSVDAPQELEEEAEGEGAFNPETGEINWDCPCLGGMAHGPCGEQFKAAFSCFVYSKEEPKGVDCIENFKNMQDCFRQHPDVYGAELADDEGDEDLIQKPSLDEPSDPNAVESKPVSAHSRLATSTQSGDNGSVVNTKADEQIPVAPDSAAEEIQQKKQRAKSATQQVKREHPVTSETEEAVPKAWHDTRVSSDAK